MRSIIKILYCIFVATLAIFTIIEWQFGLSLYTSYFFIALTFCLTVGSIAYIFAKTKNPATIILHLSLATIIFGAGITHFFAKTGNLHLRKGISQDYFVSDSGQKVDLPKQILLLDFEIINYPATNTPKDFVSKILINQTDSAIVSMNKVVNINGYRLFQSSFDNDCNGSVFMVNFDPFGMTITYLGYFMFFCSLFWLLINPKGNFRKIIKRLSIIALPLIFLSSCSETKNDLPECPTEIQASKFDKISVLYNGRIVPFNTYANDFCLKIIGKKSYKGLNSQQILLGLISNPRQWQNQNIIRIKNSLPDSCKVETTDGFCSINSLFDADGNYRLSYTMFDKPDKSMLEINDKMQLIISLINGNALKIFPIKGNDNQINWYSSSDNLPQNIDPKIAKLIREWPQMTSNALKINDNEVLELLSLQIARYQLKICGDDLPSPSKRKIEIIYNKIDFTKWLFMLQLFLGFVFLIFCIVKIIRKNFDYLDKILKIITILLIVIQAISLIVRGIISGYFPLANGYETMIFLAFCILIIGLFIGKIQTILGVMSLILSGFALLVAHIGISNPNITPLMPVLHSPWLSLHVASVMIAYSLFSVVMINSAIAIIFSKNDNEKLVRFRDISLLMLYPAVVFLGIGIFVGAIWANESWGRYWSWDPKEVWALITLLIYVIPLHQSMFERLTKGKRFHWFMIFAFSTVLMTYFGVNYLLGGMHSYAG